MIRIRTYRGQGMTEYIIIVGLIAILLMVAVGKYRFAVDEAIQGTDGAVKGIGSTSNQYSGSGSGSSTNPNPTGNRQPAGFFRSSAGASPEQVFKQPDGTVVFSNGTPLTPAELSRVSP
jgi:Flp pilus assembly pilin Flp